MDFPSATKQQLLHICWEDKALFAIRGGKRQRLPAIPAVQEMWERKVCVKIRKDALPAAEE